MIFTDLEWLILQVIWESQPVSSRDVIQGLRGKTNSSDATIKTLLHRLVDKEVLLFQRKANRYLYWAALSRAEATARACRQLVSQVFDGDSAAMLYYLTVSTNLDYHQAQYLRDLLAEIQESCPKDMSQDTNAKESDQLSRLN